MRQTALAREYRIAPGVPETQLVESHFDEVRRLGPQILRFVLRRRQVAERLRDPAGVVPDTQQKVAKSTSTMPFHRP